MKYSKPLQQVKLIRRYKRFLADVEWPDGRVMTVHTANTGSMLGCSEPGSLIWISDSENPKRKYRYSWELTETGEGGLIGVNTHLANRLVLEGIQQGVISELQGYGEMRTEVAYGENSRIDILLGGGADKRPTCYVEVKNVTGRVGEFAIFPDAVTVRGTKHLHELVEMVRQGYRSVMCFCVQREDTQMFRPALEIDPKYAETLAYALTEGVDVLAYQVAMSPQEIVVQRPLPVCVEGVSVQFPETLHGQVGKGCAPGDHQQADE